MNTQQHNKLTELATKFLDNALKGTTNITGEKTIFLSGEVRYRFTPSIPIINGDFIERIYRLIADRGQILIATNNIKAHEKLELQVPTIHVYQKYELNEL